MNAAALTASRPLIPAAPHLEAATPSSARANQFAEFWQVAEKLLSSVLWFCGVAVLLVAGSALAFGTLATTATVLGGREEAWWPAITCGALLYLFAKGSIFCWDAACAAFRSADSRGRR